jgi:hypothetical protein
MELSTNAYTPSLQTATRTPNTINTNINEKISQEDVKEIKAQIAENSRSVMLNLTTLQSSISSDQDKFEKDYQEFQDFLKDIGYDGKPIAELSQEEATDLVKEDGFFGVTQTSERMANFVIDGANGDEDLLRAGRDGIIQGYKEAQEMWGGELPEISQKTMQKTLELIDTKMSDLGFSIIDKQV